MSRIATVGEMVDLLFGQKCVNISMENVAYRNCLPLSPQCPPQRHVCHRGVTAKKRFWTRVLSSFRRQHRCRWLVRVECSPCRPLPEFLPAPP